MLFSILIHAEPLEIYISPRAKVRLHRSRNVDGWLHRQLFHTIFNDVELQGDFASNLDCSTEADLTIALYRKRY